MADQQAPAKKKRIINTRKACANCRISHTACERQRPCKRCVQKGLECSDASEPRFHTNFDKTPSQQEKIVNNGNNSQPQQHLQQPLQQPQIIPQQTFQSQGMNPILLQQQQLQQQQENFPQQKQMKKYFDDHVLTRLANVLGSLFAAANQQSPSAFSAPQQQAGLLAAAQLQIQQQTPQQFMQNPSIQVQPPLPSLQPSVQQQQQQSQLPLLSPSPQMPPQNLLSVLQQHSPSFTLFSNSPDSQAAASPLSSVLQEDIKVKIDKLEEVIAQQRFYVAQLMKNMLAVTPNNNKNFEDLLQQKYKPLMYLSTCGIGIRDKQTLQLLACNENLSKFFSLRRQNLPVSQAAIKQMINDPFMIFVILNIINDKLSEKKESIIKLMRCKFVINVSADNVALVDGTFHFEDDGIMWTESTLVVPPVFDDEFVLGDVHHAATSSVLLPVNNAEATRKLYEGPNKDRFYKMIRFFLNSVPGNAPVIPMLNSLTK